MPSFWQWLNRPVQLELRLSPIFLIGLSLALVAVFIYVGATLR